MSLIFLLVTLSMAASVIMLVIILRGTNIYDVLTNRFLSGGVKYKNIYTLVIVTETLEQVVSIFFLYILYQLESCEKVNLHEYLMPMKRGVIKPFINSADASQTLRVETK